MTRSISGPQIPRRRSFVQVRCLEILSEINEKVKSSGVKSSKNDTCWCACAVRKVVRSISPSKGIGKEGLLNSSLRGHVSLRLKLLFCKSEKQIEVSINKTES